MVAYTDSLGFNKGTAAYTSTYTNRFTVIELELDFAKIAAARVAAGAAALGSGDTLDLFTLPKGTFVLNGSATLTKAEGAAATIDVGVKGGDVDAWIDGFDLNGAVGSVGGYATGAVAVSFATADTVVLLTLNSASIDAAKVKLQFAVVNMGADQGTVPSA